MSSSKGWLVLQLVASYKTIHLKRNDKTKKQGFRFSRAANCGKVNIWGKLMEDKGSFSEVYYMDSGLIRVSGD